MGVQSKKIKDLNKELEGANQRISELEKNIKKINEESTESVFSFKEMAAEIGKASKNSKDVGDAIKVTQKSAKALASSAEVLSKFTKEDLKDKTKSRKIQAEGQKLIAQRAAIEAQITTLNIRKAGATAEENKAIDKTVEILQDGLTESEGLLKNFKLIKDTNSKLEKETGFFDTLNDTLKSIPGVGPLLAGPFKDAAQSMRDARAEGDGFFKASLAGASSLTAAFGPAALLGVLFKTNGQLVDMQRELQMSNTEADNTFIKFNKISMESGTALLTVSQLVKSQTELAKATGITAGFTEDQIKNQAKLTERIGLSAESAAEFAKYQTFTNKSARETNLEVADQVANLQKETGISLKLSDVMEEVANSSAGIQAAYGFSNKALTKAVTLAKKFGINLAQAEQISSGMLDFESSIQAELEAELLTGKELNLEKARSLALEGKSADAAAEVLKQVGSTKDLTKMNVIQQEALAKAVGMERNELIASVKEKEILRKLGAKNIEEASKTEEGRKRLIALGGEDLLQAYERDKASEQFEASVIKIQEAIGRMTLAFQPALDAFASLIANGDALYVLIGTITAVGLAGMVAKFAGMITQLRTITLLKSQQKIADAELLALETATTAEKAAQVGEETILNTEKAAGNVLSVEDNLLETTNLTLKKGANNQEKIGLGLALRNVAMSGFELMKNIGIAAMKAIQSLSSIPFVGPILGIAAAGTIIGMGMKFMSDGMVGPGGEMILNTPKGSIQFDKEDSIIAGTDLGGKNKSSDEKTKPSEKGGGAKRDAALIAKIDQLISVNQQILAKSPVIEMFGNSVGQGVQQDSVSVQ